MPTAWLLVFTLRSFSLLGAQSLPAEYFVRGDVDSNGVLDLTDALQLLGHLFQGRGIPCRDAADLDDNGRLDLADPAHLLRHLYLGGPAPVRPVDVCGLDFTEDDLDCEDYRACALEYPGLAARVEALDAVVFVLDRSGTMQDQGELATAKRIAGSLFAFLGPNAEVGVVYFDRIFVAFPGDGNLSPPTEAARASTFVFLASMAGGNGSCPVGALLKALEMLDTAAGKARGILYLSDGTATCDGADEAAYMQETLERVKSANQGAVAIHSVGIGVPGPFYEQFLRDLAEQNGGQYSSYPE